MTNIYTTFSSLGLKDDLLKSLNSMGYIKPSPIQAECIPHLLSGRDVLGMAQTGSGKTAAFALPLIHNINETMKAPQILVLTPTRELAMQVSEAIAEFSKHMRGIHTVALYGGQRYDIQLRALRQGPQVVVGTPGRLLDHLKRGTLSLSHLRGLVLDEADEMLRMGFIEDVETIMSQIPDSHQTALFSATMPEAIRRITKRFMKDPQEIRIQSSITTRPDINQSYWTVYGRKTDALTRFLEVEDFDAVIIFVRTKSATLEVSEALERSGYNSAALNGDMNQALREQTLERLKDGRLDILIATDVAARGLDVERISFVINYDIPMDVESYVHRIGRTGRAGRRGRALLFVEYRERRLLRNIERNMKLHIPEVELPNTQILSQRRLANFSKKVKKQLDGGDLEEYRALLCKIQPIDAIDIEILAAALLKMAQGERPLIVPIDPPQQRIRREYRDVNNNRRNDRLERGSRTLEHTSRFRKENSNIQLYRIDLGRDNGIEVRHIVGAIVNEGNISSRDIGHIKLFSTYATIELPKDISHTILQNLVKTHILNKPINIKLIGDIQPRYINRNRDRFSERNVGTVSSGIGLSVSSDRGGNRYTAERKHERRFGNSNDGKHILRRRDV
ncbi:DEAD/DEAH family ATP-dependent RNA helicase [Candidatus Erwinia haradaeae]|uniref:ATP-dependent RNA helicase DeaD n=1 Tax=Candidatus Erwinia haradaeae TaxID=1922217 RepID=A0A451DIA4_9GAMM|nr:DEAD/DEAH family ATP-dependent RNA helicase [Candidatus Erwinia haradaeae]VFP86400.1 ATP-dependent RNA helicase DeaD [Candidatus Erwinia haradaeae]